MTPPTPSRVDPGVVLALVSIVGYTLLILLLRWYAG